MKNSFVASKDRTEKTKGKPLGFPIQKKEV